MVLGDAAVTIACGAIGHSSVAEQQSMELIIVRSADSRRAQHVGVAAGRLAASSRRARAVAVARGLIVFLLFRCRLQGQPDAGMIRMHHRGARVRGELLRDPATWRRTAGSPSSCATTDLCSPVAFSTSNRM